VKWLDEQDSANQQMIDAIATMRQLTERMSGAIDRQRLACETIDEAAKRLEVTAETSFEMSASIEEAIVALRESAYAATDGTLSLAQRETFVLTTGS
jgi:hypothetical protein